MSKKKIVILVILTLLVLAALLVQTNSHSNNQLNTTQKTNSPTQNGAIAIGLLLPLQGEYGDLGKSALNGAKLAAKIINDEGGILGHKIELIIGDTRSSTNIAAEITREFVNKNYKIIIGGLYQEETLSILENIKDSNLFYLSDGTPLTCLKDDHLKLNNKIWGMGITPQMQTETFLISLSDKFRQAERNFNLYIYGNAGGERLTDYLKEISKGLEFNLVGEDYVDVRISDLFQRVRQIFDYHPDLLVFITKEAGTNKFLSHSHKLSLRTEMTVATINSINQEQINKLGEDADGVWTTTTYSSEIQSDENKKFLEDWKSLYKEESLPTAMAVKSYSTLKIIQEGLIKNASADISELEKGLKDIELKLPQGNVSVSSENHLLVQPLYLSQIEKGKHSKLELIGDVSHPAFEACAFPEKEKEQKVIIPEDY